MGSSEDLVHQQHAILGKLLKKMQKKSTPSTPPPSKPRLSADSNATIDSELTIVHNTPVRSEYHLDRDYKELHMRMDSFDRLQSPPMSLFSEEHGQDNQEVPLDPHGHESAIKRRKRQMREKRNLWFHFGPPPEDLTDVTQEAVCKLNVIEFWKSCNLTEEWQSEREMDRIRWSSEESMPLVRPGLKRISSDDSSEELYEKPEKVLKRRRAGRRPSTPFSDDDEITVPTIARHTTTSRSRPYQGVLESLSYVAKSPNKPDVIMDEEMTAKMPKKRGRKPNIVKVVREVMVSPEMESATLDGDGAQVQKVWGQGVIDLRSNPSETAGKNLPTWKNQPPLEIDESQDGYDMLTMEERAVCSRLRLLPVQYLGIKDTLLTAAKNGQIFKKREAQKMCRVDVNKTAKVFDWFIYLGWLGPEFGIVRDNDL